MHACIFLVIRECRRENGQMDSEAKSVQASKARGNSTKVIQFVRRETTRGGLH